MDKLNKQQLADLEMLAMFKLQDVNKARLLALELMASAGGRDLVDLRFRAEQLLKDVNRWWVTRETLGRMLDQAIEAEETKRLGADRQAARIDREFEMYPPGPGSRTHEFGPRL